MDNELVIAILAGLGGMLGWGLADFFAKKTITEIGDLKSLAWGHIFGTACLLLVAMYTVYVRNTPFHVPNTISAWGGLAFFGVLQAVVYYFVYKAFNKGQLVILNPVFSSFSGLTVLMSVLFFKEVLSESVLVSLIVVFIGILLMNIDFKALSGKQLKFIKVAGMREIITATFFAAFWTLFWSKFVSGNDWVSYALIMYIFMTITILILAKIERVSLGSIPRNVWKFLVLIGLCETVAYIAISLGYGMTSRTSIIALLSGAFSLPTIILGYLFLQEKITISQTIGSLVIILGIILISLV